MAEKKSLFDRLKVLFSTNVVVRNTGGKKLRVVDTARYQADGNPHTSKVIDRYGRLHGTRGTPISVYNQYNSFSATKIDLYTDYEAMDTDAIISSALDIYSDESTLRSDQGDVLTIRSDNDAIRKILHNLFYDILNVEYNLWPWIRNLCKYGDFYLYLDVKDEVGITNVVPFSPYEMQRDEGTDPEHIYMTKFIYEGPLGKGEFQNYEIAHFRLIGDTNFLPYGRSMLEGARKLYKQLCLPAYTKIWTPNGYTNMGDLNVGDTVYSFDYMQGKPVETTVKNKMFTGNREIFTIQTSHREIDASADHPFLMADGSYKTVQEMNVGEDIVIADLSKVNSDVIEYPPLKLSDDSILCNFDSEYFVETVSNQSSGLCLECNNIFGRITGNHLNHRHNISISGYYEKHGIHEKIIGLINRNDRVSLSDGLKACDVFGLDVSYLRLYNHHSTKQIVSEQSLKENFKMFVRFFGFMMGGGWTYDNTTAFSLGTRLDKSHQYVEFLHNIGLTPTISEENTPRAYCRAHSSYFVELLKNLGFETGTHNKKVPSWVFSLPIEYKNEFLYGMVDADGTYLRDSEYACITNSNKDMVEDMIVISQQCGNTTTNLHETTGDGFGFIGTKMYSFRFKRSGNHLTKRVNNTWVERVKKITHSGTADLYDIEVTNDNHNFIADGFVAHNCLMEDAMLIHRIMRAPEKRIFKIDIGNIPPAEVDQYMQNIMNQMKKTPVIDERTGDYNLRYNMQNILEDFYMPVRGGQAGTSIETLSGLQYQAIEDVEYLKGKIFAALKVPKAYLGFDESLEGKATLASLDIRFARTIERIQRIVVSELTKIAIVHLYAQGYENSDLVNFELSLTGPSIIYEQEKIALWKEKVDLAGSLIERRLFSMKYIYSNIFNLSEDEAEFEKNEVIEDIKLQFRQKQIESEGNDPAITKESFGTPHDLATMNLYGGRNQQQINDVEMPEGGWPGAGRPPEHKSAHNTDASPFGRDPIGRKSVGSTLDVNLSPKHKYKGNSPLSLESKGNDKLTKEMIGVINNMSGIKVKTKNIISDSLKPASEIKKEEVSMLNEDNLLKEI